MSHPPAEKVRFAIMCRGNAFPKWQATAIRQLMAQEGVELTLIIRDITPPKPKAGKVKRMLNALPFFFWKFYSQRVNKRSREMQLEDLRSELDGVREISCAAVHKGRFSQYFSPEDLQKVEETNLDFILRFGFNILRGKILNAARFGVWSYHHGDESRYRGLPAGFWEIYRGDPVSGAILQRLTDRLDGGVILRKGHLKTHPHSYLKNREALYRESANWAVQVARDIQAGQADYFNHPPSSTSAPIYRSPQNFTLLRFLWKVNWIRSWRLFRAYTREPQWNIGIVDAPIHRFLEPGFQPEVNWAPLSGPDHFKADPFGVKISDGVQIYYEHYPYNTRKGYLGSLTWNNGDFSQEKKALETDKHLSYPYLLQENGKRYVIPESSREREVALFEIDDNDWKKVSVLIPDYAGGDPTVFHYQGSWWMFVTDANDGANFKLNLWHAESLTGLWKPHPQNPVKVDIRSARPAGTPFEHEGVLYRPAQDSSEVYGGRIRIQKVLEITTETYREEEAAIVEPLKSGKFRNGIHTLAQVGNYTLVDGMRMVRKHRN